MLRQASVVGVFGSLFLLSAPTLFGQEKPKQPAARQLIVWVEGAKDLQATSRKPLLAVQDADGKAIITHKLDRKNKTYSIDVVPADDKAVAYFKPIINDPTTVRAVGLSPGTRRVILVDEDGVKETCDIIVRRMIFLPIGASQVVQMASKGSVKKIGNEGNKIVGVEHFPSDKSKVKLTGLTAGDTRFTLTSEDGKTETFEVIVRSDKVPGKNTIFVSMDAFEIHRGPDESPISSVVNERNTIVEVVPTLNDPTRILLFPVSNGITWLTVTYGDERRGNTKEATYEVIVRASGNPSKEIILLNIGQEYRLQLSTRKPIKEVEVHALRTFGHVETKRDPKSPSIVTVIGKRAGGVMVCLNDKDGKGESFYIAVRKEKSGKKE